MRKLPRLFSLAYDSSNKCIFTTFIIFDLPMIKKTLFLFKESLANNLARKFVFIVFTFSTFLALLVSALQLLVDYRIEIRDLNNSVVKIENAILPSLTESVWALDDVLIYSQLNGIINIIGFLLPIII